MIYLLGANAAIATSNAAPPAPVPGPWLTDLIAALGPATAGPAGTITQGMLFTHNYTANPCTGIRAQWGGPPSANIKLTLWNWSLGTVIATQTVAPLSVGLVQTTSLFGSHTLSGGAQYAVSMYVAGQRPVQAGMPFGTPRTYTNFIVNSAFIYTFADAFPGSSAPSYATYIEPIY